MTHPLRQEIEELLSEHCNDIEFLGTSSAADELLVLIGTVRKEAMRHALSKVIVFVNGVAQHLEPREIENYVEIALNTDPPTNERL